MKNINNIVDSILKVSVDIKELDPKIQNRILQVKKVYQQINEIEKAIKEQVGDLQKQISVLEKQTKIFEKELIPVLKELEDHAITAEGIFIELKSGNRSPKVGYEYLAERVTSELLLAAEEAISKAAEFARAPSITVSKKEQIEKTAGIFDWLKEQWNKLVNFVKSLKTRSRSLDKLILELDRKT